MCLAYNPRGMIGDALVLDVVVGWLGLVDSVARLDGAYLLTDLRLLACLGP